MTGQALLSSLVKADARVRNNADQGVGDGFPVTLYASQPGYLPAIPGDDDILPAGERQVLPNVGFEFGSSYEH